MKDNYHDLFTNPWCSLFGHLGDIEPEDTLRPQVGRCINIIDQARKIWGTNPYIADTSWPEEKDIPVYQTNFSPFVNSDPNEYSQYPFGKVEQARAIFRTRIQVHQYLFEPMDRPTKVPDIAWEETLRIVRNWSMTEIEEKTTDSEILAALAIAEAWAALGDILYYGEKEEAPEVLKTIQIASGLLTKAQELASKELIKNKEQILQDQKDDIETKDITVAVLQKALIEKQAKPKGITPVNVPSGTKWSDIDMFLTDKEFKTLDISIKDRKPFSVGFREMCLENRHSHEPLKAWWVLMAFAISKNHEIPTSGKSLREFAKSVNNIISTQETTLFSHIATLRERLRECFGIPEDPISCLDKEGGYKTLFRITDKSYAEEHRKSKMEGENVECTVCSKIIENYNHDNIDNRGYNLCDTCMGKNVHRDEKLSEKHTYSDDIGDEWD